MILSHPFQHHFCLGKPPLLHFLWTDFTLVLLILCHTLQQHFGLAGVSPCPGKAAEKARSAGDGVVLCWIHLQQGVGKQLVTRGAERGPCGTARVQLAEMRKYELPKGVWEGFCTQRVQGRLVESSCHRAVPIPAVSGKQNGGIGISGRKVCGKNTALVGGVADGMCCSEWDSLDFLVVEGQEDRVLTLKCHFPLSDHVVCVVVYESIHPHTLSG